MGDKSRPISPKKNQITPEMSNVIIPDTIPKMNKSTI
jgi:hypothetical protein